MKGREETKWWVEVDDGSIATTSAHGRAAGVNRKGRINTHMTANEIGEDKAARLGKSYWDACCKKDMLDADSPPLAPTSFSPFQDRQ